MATTTSSSFATYQVENSGIGIASHQRIRASIHRPYCLPKLFTTKQGISFSAKQYLYYFNSTRSGRANLSAKMDLNAVDNITSGAAGAGSPSGFPFHGWSNWMLLTILPMVLPFFKSKWGPLLAIKQSVDTAVETVEDMAEVVEEVAERVDKIADDVAEKLPEGSKLKEAICALDEVAEGAIKGADMVEELAQKVEEAEKNVENLIEKSKTDQVKEKNVENPDQAKVATTLPDQAKVASKLP